MEFPAAKISLSKTPGELGVPRSPPALIAPGAWAVGAQDILRMKISFPGVKISALQF
jgi:hypothetical protein